MSSAIDAAAAIAIQAAAPDQCIWYPAALASAGPSCIAQIARISTFQNGTACAPCDVVVIAREIR